VLLVVAPRTVAGGPSGLGWWGQRFALFLAALALNLALPW
jgi:hypothetical protein